MERESMVQSVSRALEIISIVSTRKNGAGVTEIAKQIDINKSSVYRTLSTLVHYGYIEQEEETGRYKLGYKFLEMSSKLLDSIDLREVAKPFLKEMEKKTNEVVHLVVHDQGEVVYIEKLEGNETLRMHSKVGRRAPMHCTSVGKAIMAHLPSSAVMDILEQKGMPMHTERTIVNKDRFLQELRQVKQQGFAFDHQENETGITCLAVPIFDHLGKIHAAASISGPTIRMTAERMEHLQKLMIELGKQISAKLGFAK
ncbi:MAG: IclR family transcriptional regulator [Bacillota bacterium]|nr:IclR family transcriptional regulator [Bacillota bacterium]